MKKKRKRYFLSVTEEFFMNKLGNHYAGGRIEVYDEKSKNGYAIYEGRFFMPLELMQKFKECFDWIELDRLPYIKFDMKEINIDIFKGLER